MRLTGHLLLSWTNHSLRVHTVRCVERSRPDYERGTFCCRHLLPKISCCLGSVCRGRRSWFLSGGLCCICRTWRSSQFCSWPGLFPAVTFFVCSLAEGILSSSIFLPRRELALQQTHPSCQYPRLVPSNVVFTRSWMNSHYSEATGGVFVCTLSAYSTCVCKQK